MALVLTKPAQYQNLSGDRRYWAYNALDCALTYEVWGNLRTKLDPATNRIYQFEMACQQPAVAMQLRGLRVDESARKAALELILADAKTQRAELDEIAIEHQGAPFKYAKGLPPSYAQCKKILYETLKSKKYYNKDGALSTDKESLKRIAKRYQGKLIGNVAERVLSLRDLEEQRKTTERGVSPDGRMRGNFTVGATETGRWSCTKDVFMDGGNLQNIDHRLRAVYVPDVGWKMAYADLEQAESRCIAYCAEDEAYIEAHETGNVHVMASHIFWPDFKWTGDLTKDKKLAKLSPAWWIPQPEAEEGQEPAFSLYDMSKRGQHGLNYVLTPQGLAIWLGCTQKEAKTYYDRYFERYPMIQEYHKWVAETVKRTGELTTPLGRRRQFYGRLWERSTVREAVAHVPQSMTGDILNLGLLRIHRELDPEYVQCLAQVHDAVLGQFKNAAHLARAAELMEVEVDVYGRKMLIPVEVETGPNWRDCG